MAVLDFRSNKSPSLGIEIELGLVDEHTMALSSSFAELKDQLSHDNDESFKPELMQSVMEINTDVCATVDEAEQDLRRKLAKVEAVTDKLGLRLWWGATHPFSKWREQKVTPNQRYLQLVELLQELARRLVTFGLHVHVGVD